jgi:leader peptidase (prepilin peptidase) / N-methyltransferase
VAVAVTISAAIVGLVLGSFANVPIQRWPRGGTVTEPKRSACPGCCEAIRASDNIPVISWLALRGRCRHCAMPIPARYLVVEVATGALFAGVAWVWGFDPLLPALLVLAWALVIATTIDLEFRIIPNRLTYRLPLVLLPLVVAAAWYDGAGTDLRRALITAIALPAVMLLLSELFRLLRGQPGIGMGDIKLAVSLGLVVGYLGGLHIVVFAYGAVISAVVIAIVLMLAGRAKLASRIPFGPYLAIGAMLVILAGDALAGLVATWLGLAPS